MFPSFLDLFYRYERIKKCSTKNTGLNSEYLLRPKHGPYFNKILCFIAVIENVRRWFSFLSLIRWQIGPILTYHLYLVKAPG
jgi:hypothetical protein